MPTIHKPYIIKINYKREGSTNAQKTVHVVYECSFKDCPPKTEVLKNENKYLFKNFCVPMSDSDFESKSIKELTSKELCPSYMIARDILSLRIAIIILLTAHWIF